MINAVSVHENIHLHTVASFTTGAPTTL
uniref:Uncharacterized protein n=1 Tax=Glossina morsitans morsitans TaxID=37546 RepID=A0A1B0FLT9_GLOMM